MITIISHFYNEEFLLPFWLKHHFLMFEHGIMIDYASTDSSVEIIKTIAPSWTIVPSRNVDFDYIEIDQEVMDIEEGISGWKTTLNTTEFLVHSDLKSYVAELEKRSIKAVRTTGLIMVDPDHLQNDLVLPDVPLIVQRHYGYQEVNNPEKRARLSRSRLLHCAKNGQYAPGRHRTDLPARIDPDLLLCWYGHSPYQQTKQRKLQIQNRIPKDHIDKGYGVQHRLTEEQLEEEYKRVAPFSLDLWQDIPLLQEYTKTLYP